MPADSEAMSHISLLGLIYSDLLALLFFSTLAKGFINIVILCHALSFRFSVPFLLCLFSIS